MLCQSWAVAPWSTSTELPGEAAETGRAALHSYTVGILGKTTKPIKPCFAPQVTQMGTDTVLIDLGVTRQGPQLLPIISAAPEELYDIQNWCLLSEI